MSHGVHAVQHEVEHEIKHGSSHGDPTGLPNGMSKRIALLIAIIALLLALSETLGKSAQTAAIGHNIEAGNLWSFFQAKNIRRTTMLTAAEQMAAGMGNVTDAAARAAMTKQIEAWKKTAARYQSEPEKGEGTVELAKRAAHAQHNHETAIARYHHYEVASALFQISIVLASATVITGMMMLTWVALGLVGVGGIFMLIGIAVPHAVHLF